MGETAGEKVFEWAGVRYTRPMLELALERPPKRLETVVDEKDSLAYVRDRILSSYGELNCSLLDPIFAALEADLESILRWRFEIPPFADPVARNRVAGGIAIMCRTVAELAGRMARQEDPNERPPEARRMSADALMKRSAALALESSAARLLMRLTWARAPRVEISTQVAVVAEVLNDRSFLHEIRGWKTSNVRQPGKTHGRAPGPMRAHAERNEGIRRRAQDLRESDTEKSVVRQLAGEHELSSRQIQRILKPSQPPAKRSRSTRKRV